MAATLSGAPAAIEAGAIPRHFTTASCVRRGGYVIIETMIFNRKGGDARAR
jgi:hypothetical protein